MFSLHLQFDDTFGSPSDERGIFVVDDDANDRALFLRALTDAGIKNPCRFFSSGEQMIDALIEVLQGATSPLVCFLDVNMPGVSGLDVLRWIRLQDALAEVSVVMLSSNHGPASLHDAQRHGAQCCAEKFPSAAQLREIVNEAGKISAVASGHSAFNLPGNLLLASQQPTG